MKRKVIRTALIIAVALLALGIGAYNALLRLDHVSAPEYRIDRTPYCITMPMNRLVLVRSGEHFGAFKILRLASRKGVVNGAKYEYWYQGDGSADLSEQNVAHGSGIVFERYRKVDDTEVEDAGSELNIKAGRLWVEWSSGNHIYVQPHWTENGNPVTERPEITATPWSDVSQVDVMSPDLRWIKAPMMTNETSYLPTIESTISSDRPPNGDS